MAVKNDIVEMFSKYVAYISQVAVHGTLSMVCGRTLFVSISLYPLSFPRNHPDSSWPPTGQLEEEFPHQPTFFFSPASLGALCPVPVPRPRLHPTIMAPVSFPFRPALPQSNCQLYPHCLQVPFHNIF